MLKQLRNNERGVVLITVLMILILMMTIVINLLALRVSQSMIEVRMARELQAEMMAQGMLALIFANRLTNTAGNTFQQSFMMDGVNFTATAVVNETGLGIFNTDPTVINIYF